MRIAQDNPLKQHLWQTEDLGRQAAVVDILGEYLKGREYQSDISDRRPYIHLVRDTLSCKRRRESMRPDMGALDRRSRFHEPWMRGLWLGGNRNNL